VAKILREPLLHFFVLGFALFLAYAWLSGRGVVAGDRIVITQGRIAQLAAGFDAIHQRMPTASELDGMIDEAVREEIYSREAKSMGLDQDDTIIRRRLVTKLQFLSEDTTPVAEPTEAQLQEYLDAHASDFRVVFRRDGNFRNGFAWSAPSPELRFVRRKTPCVATLRRSHRLMGVAPNRSAFQIPEITNRARYFAGRIGVPAGNV